MKYLCTPRLSWMFFMGLVVGLEILRSYGDSPVMMASAGVFFLFALLADWLVQAHLTDQRARDAEAELARREVEAQQAEQNPSVLARLKTLSETVNVQEVELETLTLELKIAVAEKERAEEEREDIRKVLNFNRTALRAEQLESQDLRERLGLAAALPKAGAL